MSISNATEMEAEHNMQLLSFIFQDAPALYDKLSPRGWTNSEYVRFFHPTARQQFEEHVRMNENINRLTKTATEDNSALKEDDFTQDDLKVVDGYSEFLYVLGLSVYDVVENQITINQDSQEIEKLRKELNAEHDKAFENAKYEPLIQIVQAHKSVFGFLPNGHPQKGL